MKQTFTLILLLAASLLCGQKPRLVLPIGHTGPVNSVVFSPDGKLVLTGSGDKTAKLWDLSGRELQTFSGHDYAVNSVAFSPDGKQILTCSYTTAKLWDLSGKELQTFTGHAEGIIEVAFSPDGKLVLTGSGDKTAKLWDLSGRVLQTFTGHESSVVSVAFSPDGKQVLTGSVDNTAKLWDLSGRVLQTFYHDPYNSVRSVVFSPDGKHILTGSAFNIDKLGVLMGKGNSTAKLWDLSGRVLQTFSGHASFVYSVAFSPDGKQILTGSDDKTAKLWDLSGRVLQTFTGHAYPIFSVAFSPNGKQVLTGSWDKTAKLWDLSGRVLKSFTGHAPEVWSVAFLSEGKQVLTGSWDNTAKLWDLSGKVLQSFTGDAPKVFYDAYSPDGKLILTGGEGNTAELLDFSRRVLQTFIGHEAAVRSKTFSPDGKLVLTGSFDKTAKLWDLSGRLLQTFVGHTAEVSSAAISPNGKLVLTGSGDNTAKLWDTKSGTLLATLIATDSSDWVVTTPTGLFDASPGAMKLMHYMVGLEVIELEQLKDRYYEPGLLPKLLGFAQGGLRPVDELNNVPLYPEILEASIQNDTLRVRLKPRNGGIGKVALLRAKDQELVVDINPQRKTDFAIDLKPYASQIFNNLYLRLYNQEGEGWLKSQLYPLEYSPDGVGEKGLGERKSLNKSEDAKLEEINFYALVVGTSKFRGTQLNLKYPDLDAASFANALRQAGNQLFSKDRTHVQLLSTETEPWPRKAEIRNALMDIDAKATIKDILLIYFSGHGITYPPNSEKGQFYYLTTDIAGDKLDDPVVLGTQAIGLDSLMEWVRPIDANKRILILDACNSGSVVENLEPGAKELNSDQRRALERANDRSGMFVLAGSAADKSSFEASSYGHGLLTYSLLNGMLKVAAENNKNVELGDLFAYVEDDVPVLAKNINRVQKPEVIKAESYPIGRIDENVQIKMPTERPVFVRVSMMDVKKNKDLLGLTKTLNAELERVSSEKNPSLVFWDVESYAGKYYYLGGQYESIEGSVKGNASLYLNDTELTKFPVSGSVNALSKLAKDLIFDVQEYLAKNPGK